MKTKFKIGDRVEYIHRSFPQNRGSLFKITDIIGVDEWDDISIFVKPIKLVGPWIEEDLLGEFDETVFKKKKKDLTYGKALKLMGE